MVSSKETSNPDLSSALPDDVATNILFLPSPSSSHPNAPQNFQETPRQGLLKLNNNAVVFPGKLSQDPVGSVRPGRKMQRGQKPDNAQHLSFGMPAPSFSYVRTDRMWGTRSMFLPMPPHPGGARRLLTYT